MKTRDTIKAIQGLQDAKREKRYKVIKVMRISGRRQVLERNLTENEAQGVVKRHPNSKRSMVIYTVQ